MPCLVFLTSLSYLVLFFFLPPSQEEGGRGEGALTLKASWKCLSYTCNQVYGNHSPCRNNKSKELSAESEPEKNYKCVRPKPKIGGG